MMDAISAHFSVNEDVCLPTARQGSGLISLQGLMLLPELGRAQSEAGKEFLMALEEPELHLPLNITLFELAVDPPRLWSKQREKHMV